MKDIAVLIPVYNEELTINKVINDFRNALPSSKIYVYDNNSTDKSYDIAVDAGAIVRKAYQQGKGNVVKKMFREIDADVYVMVDGDDTYPAEEVQKLIDPILNEDIDMVIGDRLSNGTYFKENKRSGHSFGNKLVKNLINHLFHAHINDIMTGYRAFSRKYVKNMPVMSDGFQIETEMTAYSLEYGMSIKEVPITYRDRPDGSYSKLNTVSDGTRVLLTLFDLWKAYRPMLFFSIVSLIFLIIGLIVGIPVVTEFLATSFVSKVPSAILATSLIIIAILMFIVGIILDAIKNQTKLQFETQINKYYQDSHNKN